jgi:hypothetical protein
MNERNDARQTQSGISHPYRARLPGFIVDEEVGLGDVIKRVSYATGIKPCGGCDKRAAAMNRWMVFSPRSRKG